MGKEIILFETKDHSVTLKVPVENETVWLTQEQMVELFGRDVSVISRHIKNVFKENEVDRESNLQKMQIAHSDKPVIFYSLDVIISVGYRVKSQRGVEFRRWANSVLKKYILKGYALNGHRLEQLGQMIQIMKRAAGQLDSKQVLSVMESYQAALDLLDDYDHQTISKPTGNQATGNKRIAATMFLYFLDRNNALFIDRAKRIDDYTLVALTIMIAESKPDEKEMMIKVIMNCMG